MATTPHSSRNLSEVSIQPLSQFKIACVGTAALGCPYVRLKARCSAPSYASRNSCTLAETTESPPTAISTLSDPVSPSTSATTPYSSATCWIRGRWTGSQLTTTRLASSPNNTNSSATCCRGNVTLRPTPAGRADSTSATASPPSAQSRARTQQTPPATPHTTSAGGRGLNQSRADHGHQRALQRGFLLEIQSRRIAPHGAENLFRVLGRSKLHFGVNRRSGERRG